MEAITLLNNSEKYSGKYVALRSFKEKDAITSGKNPLTVYNKAKKAGAKNPVILYVPEKDAIHIY